ncbi:Alpha-1,6-mannosyl-glycoprotein 2-beta-N-acetylglucosaminyltransferase [Strongyloides ratti]|uniref:Alpha-1,6-mannosyl-glycoprotein 2-beta-N-acetylglucosaminyltransferase n=1 Tax=Strongyloides ratti TaxID=34506 RepID=A0A090KX05_STRRB|nr:Alpha-1,6-mannosyl-glycoprotein 2-beta-N-acetylglucosaminyltransferase [Strongyloides ratti]CEF59747.1 Alpha-1,6-mannosyl-glycoprotein 2-beta-N-acetylglucosaminyltransferase [Strongyloides ratti]
MLNYEKFRKKDIKYIILVQVHNRLDYLQILINSLENLHNIENCLIIFSHDVYKPEIDKPIKNITFGRVLQIYFPYNLQLFPNIFPGLSNDDCPPSISKDESEKLNCSSKKQYDTYGHYRDPNLSQIKHHWWWKLNFVFEKVFKRFRISGKIILVEEDHYVMPDMLHVLNLITIEKKKLCLECNIIVLGSYKFDENKYIDNINKISVMQWYSSMHNMGMVIDTNLWNNINKCSELFCTYDDYNWDWTLLKISLDCMNNKMKALSITSPRILHIGDCGIHKHDCHSQKSLLKATNLLELSKNNLFPDKLFVNNKIKKSPKPPKPNGGWNDVRDHYLCLHNSYILPKNEKNSFFSDKYQKYQNNNGFFPFMDLNFLQTLP